MQPYIIFFRGLDGLIDESAGERLAENRGCAAMFYHYAEWPRAAEHVGANPDAAYHVVGFSRGAAPDIVGGFMSTVRQHKWRLPEDLMTIGLYHGTPRYKDPIYECINYLDSTGQTHAGEHDCVNLGPHVPHLGPGSGMELVADRFAPKAAPSPPLAGEGEEGAPAPATSSTILTKQSWPTQARATAFYGNPGSAGWAAAHLVQVECPWTLHTDKVSLHQIQIHKVCAPSLNRILDWVWETSDKDPEKIAALRYDRFSGSYNYRPMRGGAALSMHAYGAAIDWDDADNAQHSRKHLFTAGSPLIKAFLDEGWEWGGNWSGSSIDAMHVQAAHVR